MLHLADGVLLEDAAPGAELLAGELAAGDDYSLWLSAQRRAQCQAQRQRVLKGLAAAEDDGDLDAALHHAQALLALGAHDESHHTALMREHFLRGEAAGLADFQYPEPGSVDPPGHPARPRTRKRWSPLCEGWAPPPVPSLPAPAPFPSPRSDRP